MQNVEFKAELRDAELASSIAAAIGARFVAVLLQRDTYYRVPHGRLKRRECEADGVEEPAEFIRYERHERPSPRISRFTVLTDNQAREHFGAAPLPVWLVVQKTRRVLMYENARVHLDAVGGLGDFIEFEALVTRRHNVARAHELIERLRRHFAPAIGEPIAAGYADLVATERGVPLAGSNGGPHELA